MTAWSDVLSKEAFYLVFTFCSAEDGLTPIMQSILKAHIPLQQQQQP